MKKTLTGVLITLLSLTYFESNACSCIGESTVQSEFKGADAVIVGTILNKEHFVIADSSILKRYPKDTTIFKARYLQKVNFVCYSLLIEGVYKGKITKDTIRIFTGMGGGDCGIRFETGQRYIIYGQCESYFGLLQDDTRFSNTKNTFWANLCTRTMIYSESEIAAIETFAKKKKR